MDVDLKNLKKLVTTANQRIAKIENKYGDNAGLGAWGVRNLYDAIDNNVVNGISQVSGNIKISKNMSNMQLKAVEKATIDVCEKIGNAAFVRASDLPSNEEAIHNGDLDHFCKKSILTLGERYFDAFASLKKVHFSGHTLFQYLLD